MSEFNFETPSRQSVKGIVFLLLPSIVKSLKSAYIPLIYYIIQFFREPERSRDFLPYIIFGIIGLLGFYLIRSILSFQNFKFSVSKDHFVLSRGITKKKRIEIPRHKIQNVHLKQSLLQRLVGVVEVAIDTAGDTSTEVTIKALENTKARALRTVLLNMTSKEEVKDTRNYVLRISFKELLLAGITQNHFTSFYLLSAVLFGVLVDFRDVAEMFGYEGMMEELKEKATNSASYTFLIYVVLAVIVILTSIGYSIFKVILTNYGLAVIKNREGLEIHKGLFNRISYALNASKIQSVVYTTNALKQRLGLFNLRFNQAMSTEQSKKNIGLVAVQKANLSTLERFVFGYPIDDTLEKKKPAAYFKTQLFLNTAFPLIIVNVFAISLWGAKVGLVNLVLVPWFFLLHWLRYRKSYYSLHKDYMVVGEGRIDTVTHIFEHHKIQSLKLKQSFFQKRREVASIHVHTAASLIVIPAVPFPEAMELYDDLLYKVETSNKNWI
ncbi:PH domain-containing protein [Spongiimicrobium salis]|uniref:PH domain-containing protein n=1 Tax=Spongiimicrobium salis TaxID=1667022 RepID=UPI00374CEBAC